METQGTDDCNPSMIIKAAECIGLAPSFGIYHNKQKNLTKFLEETPATQTLKQPILNISSPKVHKQKHTSIEHEGYSSQKHSLAHFGQMPASELSKSPYVSVAPNHLEEQEAYKAHKKF